MKKNLLIILLFVTLGAFCPPTAFAQYSEYDYGRTTVSPRGKYDYIRMFPRPDDRFGPPFDYDSCSDLQGQIYLNRVPVDRLTLCFADPFPPLTRGEGHWERLPGVWKQNRNLMGLTDTNNPELKRVGIGTSTPELKLTIEGDGGIFARGEVDKGFVLNENLVGATFLWYPRKAAILFGNIAMGATDRDIGHFSIAFGATAQGSYATNYSSFIPEGSVVSGEGATALGEIVESVTGRYATIYAFSRGAASGEGCVVAGGGSCIGDYSTSVYHIGSDPFNSALGEGAFQGVSFGTRPIADFSTIASGSNVRVVVGQPSTTAGQCATILSGFSNIANGFASTIIAGSDNVIHQNAAGSRAADHGFIGNGSNNHIYGLLGTILSGTANHTGSSADASIGDPNDFRGATILSGSNNSAEGDFATLISGGGNTASGDFSFIGQGASATASGGWSTIVMAERVGVNPVPVAGDWGFMGVARSSIVQNFGVVLGGELNVAGVNSFAGGRNSQALGANSFLWGNSANAQAANDNNVFIVMSTNVILGGITPAATNPRLTVNGDMLIDNGTLQLTGIVNNGSLDALEWDTVNRVINDVAETFDTVEGVEPGDVLTLDEKHAPKLKKTRAAYDKNIIGVVSAAPAAIFEGEQLRLSPVPSNSKKQKRPPVALAGRVLIKVCLENGPITSGDLLTSSNTPGHAMRATDLSKARHGIVAKALQSFSGGTKNEKVGRIEAIIMNR